MTPLELLALEAERRQHPDDYPMRALGTHIDEYWAYWTPERLDSWREVGR